MQTTMLPPTMGGRLVVLPLVSWYIRGVGPPFGAATGRCRLILRKAGPVLACDHELFLENNELYVRKLSLDLYLCKVDEVVVPVTG